MPPSLILSFLFGAVALIRFGASSQFRFWRREAQKERVRMQTGVRIPLRRVQRNDMWTIAGLTVVGSVVGMFLLSSEWGWASRFGAALLVSLAGAVSPEIGRGIRDRIQRKTK